MKAIKSLLAGLAAICAVSTQTYAQCGPYPSGDPCNNCATVTLPVNTISCAGAPYVFTPTVSLPAGFSVLSYTWTPTAGVSPATGTGMPPTTSITVPTPGTPPPPCSVIGYPYNLLVTALGPNIIANGNFTAGNTQFCSNYGYNPTPSTLGASQRTIGADAAVIPGFLPTPPHFYDHTTGTPSGSMYIGDADGNVSLPWQQKVPVCPGQRYYFSFWAATLHTTTSVPNFIVTITDGAGGVTSYGPYATSTMDAWRNFTFVYNNPAGGAYTGANITITLASGFTWGTVFALDDIAMSRICNASGSMLLNVRYTGITGPSTVCLGSTISLSGCTPGGIWSSGNPSIATVSGTGVVTGVSGGTTSINYTDPSGCKSSTNITVSVPSISGPTSVCVGNTITWTASTGPGYWTCSAGLTNLTGAGTTSTGTFTGNTAGAATITFTDAVTGCSITKNVTVKALPVILGPANVCAGDITTWTSTTSGMWSSSGATMYDYYPSAVSTSGMFYPYMPGGPATVILTDTLTGCVGTLPITINPIPTGIATQHLCIGASVPLSSTPTGGTWTSANTAIASVDVSTNTLYGIAAGYTTITYTLPTGCKTISSVYVYNCAGGSGVVGGGTYCQGYGVSFSLATGIASGGTWSSSNTAVGTVDATTGAFTTVGAGTTTITYIVGSSTYTTTVTIIAAATACVTSAYTTDWYYTFTSNCSGTATIYCQFYSASWAPIGTPFTITPGTYSAAALATMYGSSAPRICVTGVMCNGCYYPANCCAAVNYLKGTNGEENEVLTSNDVKFSVVPNPTTGSFMLSGGIGNSTSKSVEFQITDMMGKTVYNDVAEANNGTVNKNIVLDSKLPNGIYFIKIKDEAGGQMIRFVLSR